jgi:hypothetical protein
MRGPDAPLAEGALCQDAAALAPWADAAFGTGRTGGRRCT